MPRNRELRDRLERAQAELQRAKTHLEKLRAHHAREREALQQEVDASRREVAALLTRLEELAARAKGPAPVPAQVSLPRAPMEGREPSTLVALVRRPEPLEQALPVLSRLLGIPPVDVRLRLASPPPSILVRMPAAEAEALRGALHSEGFVTVSCEARPHAKDAPLAVRQFILDEQELLVDGAFGERRRMPYSELRLLVQGRRKTTSVTEQVSWEYSSGLERMARGRQSPKLTRTEVKTDHYSVFLWLYADGGRVAFTQSTQFRGLGAQRGLTIYENLQTLKVALTQRAPQLVVDERLFGLPQLSLPMVTTEHSHALFAELLFQAVRQGVWP